MNIDRRRFVRRFLLGGSAVMLSPAAMWSQNSPRPEPYGQELIREFVMAGHNNLARVKEMLADYPNLINGTWDWGGGDFEMAIGGAGHVGDKEIANYLISHGARVNLFVLTMLGKTDLVKPVLQQFPELIFARGPHGFTLLHHAQQGGEAGRELADFLKSKGLKQTKVAI